MLKSNNFFKIKLNGLDFRKLSEVKIFIEEIESIPKEDREEYVLKNNISDKLKDIYWIHLYGSKEDFLIAESILDETMFSGVKYPTDELLKKIEDLCILRDKPELFNKICNICPNGDIVVTALLQDLIY